MTSWFTVDKAGLADILERRGKAFAILELVSNAWDAQGVTEVRITTEPCIGSPYVKLMVMDDSPEGWADLGEAHTMFARSRRGADPNKRGRFGLGEKLVLACCRWADIQTTTGTMSFGVNGRSQSPSKIERGTIFIGEIRMSRAELEEAEQVLRKIIPPVPTYYNGKLIVPSGSVLASVKVKLPTEIESDGVLRRTIRETMIDIHTTHATAQGETGDILELGVPICDWALPYRVNVRQKVPMNLERDSVTDAFRRAVQVAVFNTMADHITGDMAAEPWAEEAMGDSRAQPEAVRAVFEERFGDRVVVATPNDPMANAQAAAQGMTVLSGGVLGASAWGNVRKYVEPVSASQAFPSSKPKDQTGRPVCPQCNRPM